MCVCVCEEENTILQLNSCHTNRYKNLKANTCYYNYFNVYTGFPYKVFLFLDTLSMSTI